MAKKPGDSLQVGDELFLVDTLYRKSTTRNVKVNKVGRVYFEVETCLRRARFRLDTWRQDTEYSPYYYLWPSEEDYMERRRCQQLRTKIATEVGSYGSKKFQSLNIDQLTQIAEIIGIEIDN